MECPTFGEVRKLIYDSERHFSRRNPYRQNIHGLPQIIPYGLPSTSRPVAHCMLAYSDNTRSYFIYSKCIYAEDLVMICNTLVSTRAAGHIQIYEISRPFNIRLDYVDLAYIICFEQVFCAPTLAEQLTNLFLLFRQLVEARGYVFRRYYDDAEAGLPVTSHSPWRPRIPKMAKGWDEMLNIPFRVGHS